MIGIEPLREPVTLHQTINQLEQLHGAQIGVHPLILPLLGVIREPLPERLGLREGEVLGVLLARGGGEEDDVVDGLDQLQLDHAADQQAGEQLVILVHLRISRVMGGGGEGEIQMQPADQGKKNRLCETITMMIWVLGRHNKDVASCFVRYKMSGCKGFWKLS